MMYSYKPLFLEVQFNPLAIEVNELIISLLGYVIVFTALLILYLVFRYLVPRIIRINFSQLFSRGTASDSTAIQQEISGEVNASIAMALYLYISEIHDHESDVLTIRRISKPYSPWNSKIYSVGHIR